MKLTFTHQGRGYTLTKSPGAIARHRAGILDAAGLARGVWFLRAALPGVKGDRHSLGTSDNRDAITRAKALLTSAANTATDTRADALESVRALLKGAPAETLRQVAALLRPAPGLTLGEFLPIYQAAATAARVSPNTVADNLRAAHQFAALLGSSVAELRLGDLTAATVFRWKQAVSTRAEAAATDAQTASAYRSANSTLRKLKSLFTNELAEAYRFGHGLTLPANLVEFRAAPGFSDVAKTDYRIPSDTLLAATFASLSAGGEGRGEVASPNPQSAIRIPKSCQVAIWLALGFGLRKSEAAAVRGDWIVLLDGVPHLELRRVADPKKHLAELPTTKNGTVCPRIRVTNGAWEHLAPAFAAAGNDYVIPGSPTYRCESVFREIADWMRTLGWNTQKAYHEWRAYAGCQVAMRDGLLTASQWLRHSSITVTEAAYGRYIRTTATDAPLQIPKPPAAFVPHLVASGT